MFAFFPFFSPSYRSRTRMRLFWVISLVFSRPLSGAFIVRGRSLFACPIFVCTAHEFTSCEWSLQSGWKRFASFNSLAKCTGCQRPDHQVSRGWRGEYEGEREAQNMRGPLLIRQAIPQLLHLLCPNSTLGSVLPL